MIMQTRELALGKPDAKSRTVPLTLSTETPVDRGDYREVLDHAGPGSVDLSRAPLPLIESHDASRLPIGTVDQLRVENRKLRGVARFGNSQRAQEVFQDIQDGILRSVSIAYEYVGNPAPQGDGNTLRFKFKPLEVSAVSVPADPNAGFYRSHNLETRIMDSNDDQNVTPLSDLSRSQRRAARLDAEAAQSAAELERARCAEIDAMCAAHKIPADLRADMIRDGTTIPEARNIALAYMTRTRPPQRPLSDYGSFGRGSDGDILGMEPGEARRFSIVRAMNAIVNNDWRKAGLERAASDAVARQLGRESQGFFVPRDVLTRASYATGAPATGGTLVGTELLAGSFVDVLRNKTRVIELGATMLSGLVGNVDIPRRTSATAASWVIEDQALTESEGTFDKLSLTPKTIGAYSRYSRNMLMQGTPDIEMLVRSDLAAVLALGIDAAAINGPGTAGTPLGILNAAGVGSVIGGANGALVTFDHLIDLATTVAAANADSGSLAYLASPKVLGALSKSKASTGQYLWPTRGQAGAENAAPANAVPGGTGNTRMSDFSALGYPLAISNQAPDNLTKGTSVGICSAIIFGNWSDVIIGEWGVLEILPNPYDDAAYKAGAVLIRAMQTIDVGIRHGASFAVMTDALTS